MRHGFRRIWLLGLVSAVSTAAAADSRTTLEVDAVELMGGKEVKGDPALRVERNGYAYLFSSVDNKTLFEKSPEKYEIQLGGACARMGPLSGRGTCEIFAVHDSRVYIFASPQCRASFLKAPEKLLESDDPPVSGDDAARRRGMELVERMVAFSGGAARIDAVATFRQRADQAGVQNGQATRQTSAFLAAFPDRFRVEDTWNDSKWGHAVAAAAGFMFSSGEADQAMVAAQVRAARRSANHHLLVILKSRKRPDFAAAALGGETLDGVAAERVAVWFDGSATTLTVDARSGRVLRMTYIGRGPRMAVGTLVKTITEWTTEEGIALPSAWTVGFEGETDTQRTTTLSAIEIDPGLAPDLFPK